MFIATKEHLHTLTIDGKKIFKSGYVNSKKLINSVVLESTTLIINRRRYFDIDSLYWILKGYSLKATKDEIVERLKQVPHSFITQELVKKYRKEYKLTLSFLKETSGITWKLDENKNPFINSLYAILTPDICNKFVEEFRRDMRGIEFSPCQILPYSEKATSHFSIKDKGKLTGIELELEEVDSLKLSNAHKILGSHCIFKSDGSLSHGVEIVTKPAHLFTHKKVFEEFFDSDHGLVAKPNCGIHIHLERKGMSFLQLGKLIEFLNREGNKNFLCKIAGRNPNNYWKLDSSRSVSWFAENVNYGTTQISDRYQALNLSNKDTVEFRMFKSTTNFEEFMKNLEFVYALHSFTIPGALALPIKDVVKHETFINWVRQSKKEYPNLNKFIGE